MVVPIVVIWHEFGNKYSGRSDQYNFPSYESLQEGRVELLVALTEILKVLGCVGLCYFGCLTLKLVVAILICRHPELSEKKVKYITSMIAKDRHQSNYFLFFVYANIYFPFIH